MPPHAPLECQIFEIKIGRPRVASASGHAALSVDELARTTRSAPPRAQRRELSGENIRA
jgi:hypothetical protein